MSLILINHSSPPLVWISRRTCNWLSWTQRRGPLKANLLASWIYICDVCLFTSYADGCTLYAKWNPWMDLDYLQEEPRGSEDWYGNAWGHHPLADGRSKFCAYNVSWCHKLDLHTHMKKQRWFNLSTNMSVTCLDRGDIFRAPRTMIILQLRMFGNHGLARCNSLARIRMLPEH